MQFWNAKTGQPIGRRQPVANLPTPDGSVGVWVVALSPNGRYLVNARGGPTPDFPFRLTDTGNGRDVLSFTWKTGHVFFTADSSRVLVAEPNGRCRWFKLPSGEPDGGFDLGPPRNPVRSHVVSSISADGRVIGYTGPGPDKAADAQGQYVLDGRTGAVVRAFGKGYFFASPVGVSADGRLATALRSSPQMATDLEIDVLDLATGAVAARVAVPNARGVIVASEFTPDGRSLVMHDGKGGRLYLFELPALPGPPG